MYPSIVFQLETILIKKYTYNKGIILCQKYNNVNKDKKRNIDYDGDTNIFYSQFLSAINRINQTELTLDDAKKIIGELKIKLDNDDLGKSFFQILQSDIDGIKLIDFNDIEGTKNNYTVVTELPYENGNDNFRPDIVVLINGMPLSFIEVKRHNNREGILTE